MAFRMRTLPAAVLVVLGLFVSPAVTAPDVSLSRGILTGVDESVAASQKPYHVYYAIPFAQPPLGSLRFQPPRPFYADNPSQVINSRSFKPGCVQQASLKVPHPQSEDCLYLNVYTPSVGNGRTFNTDAGRKVMFWIHGGGYVTGDAIIYRPTRLVTDYDVIVVTTQYRLGAFGFLSSGDEALPGNMGLRDQQMALQWVKDNIRRFGGDPDDITIFGESAGGSSVSLLSIVPSTRGLFTKGIMQSGTALCPWAVVEKPEVAFYAIAKAAKCIPSFYVPLTRSLQTSYSRQIMECLQQLGARELLNLTIPDVKDKDKFVIDTSDFSFGPVVDGVFIPKDPFAMISNSTYLRQVGALDRKYIVGFNNNEYVTLAYYLFGNKEIKDQLGDLESPFTRDTVKNTVQSVVSFPLTSDILNFVTMMYLFPRTTDNKVDIQGPINLLSDVNFVVPSVMFADALVKASPSLDLYLYLFDHYPQVSNPDVNLGGSSHALDILFLFDENPAYVGDLTVGYGDIYSPSALPLLDVFRGSLTSLAKSGIPSTGAGNSRWPRYDIASQNYMALSASPEVRQRVFRRRVAFWVDFLPRVVGTIFTRGPGRAPFRI